MRRSAKRPPRSGLPASAICTEPRGGSNKKCQRVEEEERGPNKHVPTHTPAGSNPAWAPVQWRKLPAAVLESAAGRLINGQNSNEKRKSGNRREGTENK